MALGCVAGLAGCTNWHAAYTHEKAYAQSVVCTEAQREVEIDEHLRTLGLERQIFEQTPTLPRACRQVTH